MQSSSGLRALWPADYLHRLKRLCLGDADDIAPWLGEKSVTWPLFCCAVIVLGCGMNGVTVGLWRSPLQGFYTGLKVPLLIVLTCGGNALLNGMLGAVAGVGLTFRQTMMAILMSFVIMAIILGALSPLALFLLWNTPALHGEQPGTGHSITLLTHVLVIAYAGVVANRRLFQLLVKLGSSMQAARLALFGWLGGNLLLGSQFSWVMRPFIGSPQLPVQFFREDPMRGNFFESLWGALSRLLLN